MSRPAATGAPTRATGRGWARRGRGRRPGLARRATLSGHPRLPGARADFPKELAHHEFPPKVAIVTGAGTGIGKAVALALLKDGYRVALAGRRARAAGRRRPPSRAPRRERARRPDRRRRSRVRASAVRRRPRPRSAGSTCCSTTPGVGAPAVNLEDLTLRAVEDASSTSTSPGVFLCTQEAIRLMKSQDPRGGRIINNGSISAHAPRPNSAPYTATKHAITGLTKSTSLDGRKYDIACGQIDIGNAHTELAARMAKRRAAGERADRRRAADGRRARRERGRSTWRACRWTRTCSS